MSFAKLFEQLGPSSEPSALTAFASGKVERLAENRTDDSLNAALKDERCRHYALSGSQLVLKHDDNILDPLFAHYELAELDPDYGRAILLGTREGGEPIVALPVNAPVEVLERQFRLTDARSLYREHLLAEDLLGEFALALSLSNWNNTNQFCGKCGGKMQMRIGGYRRECESCQHLIFPRTDPVVIMLTVDLENDRCLLGRGAHFAANMYSCLAGFVEPGETLEDAVRRETREESSIEVGQVKYYASQPWPMPHTLMIGCFALATSHSISRDEQELEDCRWFSRQEVRDMLLSDRDEGPKGPHKGAIAYRLMYDWAFWEEAA
jgi:NAD+ diphosphatase